MHNLIILLGLFPPKEEIFVVFLECDSHRLKHLMKNGCWCKVLLLFIWTTPHLRQHLLQPHPDHLEKIPVEELFSRLYLLITFQVTGFYRQLQSEWTELNTRWKLSLSLECSFASLSACTCKDLDNHMKIIFSLFELVSKNLIFLKKDLKLFFKPSSGF